MSLFSFQKKMIISILFFSLVYSEDVENVNGVRGDNVTLT